MSDAAGGLLDRVRSVVPLVAEQHTMHVTRADGFVGKMDVCFIGYTRAGKLSRIYEYFDTGRIAELLGPQ